MSVALLEALLPDLMLTLHDVYGSAFPRPQGGVVQFTVIDNNTTEEAARAKMAQLLRSVGLNRVDMTITPGPEVASPWNRKIVLLVKKNWLM